MNWCKIVRVIFFRRSMEKDKGGREECRWDFVVKRFRLVLNFLFLRWDLRAYGTCEN